MLHITPSGLHYTVALSPRKRKAVIWGRDVRVVFKAADTDGSAMHALAEAAIPWSELGVRPREGTKIGFQFYVTDRDAPEGERVISSWTGEPHNQNNPSEWGTLILEARSSAPAYLIYGIAGAAAIALGLGLTWTLRRTRAKPATPDSQEPEPPAALERDAAGVICEQAIRYIEEHLTEPSLNRNAIAKHLNLSGPYLSSVFNKKLKTSLPAYVNQRRLEQACRLLKNKDNSISRVALEVGYNTPDHFIRTFKSAYRMTPREFQRRNIVPKPEDQE
jgi:AraC-like DNA-binding protein